MSNTNPNTRRAASLLTSFLFLLFVATRSSSALDNGLARTPPMGWISWERFICNIDCKSDPANCISERLYLENAQALKSKGFLEAGYSYINIDDCWSTKQRSIDHKSLVADPDRFPRGIDGLASQVHELGIKLGIYGDCGSMTCAGYPAQLKSNESFEETYLDLDANTFASWQVDSFKFDGCNIDPAKAESVCPRVAKAFELATNKTARPVLITCEWPTYSRRAGLTYDAKLVAKSCNIWRYFEDILDSWSSINSILDFTVKTQDLIVENHGPGGWFDPDQLVIGNFGLSRDQAVAHMVLWCMWSAPMFMSNDLRRIDDFSTKLLQHSRLIQLNQDELGVFGMMVDHVFPPGIENPKDGVMAFVKPCMPISDECPSWAIAYLNRQAIGNTLNVSLSLKSLLTGDKVVKMLQVAAQRTPKGVKIDPIKCMQQYASIGMGEKLFEVENLLDGLFDGIVEQPPSLADNNLTLVVNPSGVKIVKLIN